VAQGLEEERLEDGRQEAVMNQTMAGTAGRHPPPDGLGGLRATLARDNNRCDELACAAERIAGR
jgi:hypothetical protein